MILAAGCGRVHISEQESRYMMFAGKSIIIVKMTVPTDGLAVFRVRHGHRTRHDFILRLIDGNNGILRVIITPRGEEQRIRIVICQAVVGSIVNREQRLKRQALDKLVHVIVDTGIKLELSAYSPCLTTKIAVSNGIRLCSVGTTAREPSSINQVKRLAERSQSHAGIGVNHFNRNQWSGTLREVGTHVCSIIPEITLILVLIIVSSTNISPTRDEFVHNQVHITTYTETIGIVILCRTEIDKIFVTIVVDVRIEVGTRTATLDFQCTLRAVIGLADIIVRVVINIGITVRICTNSMIVDILLRVRRLIIRQVTLSNSIVIVGFVIERHVLRRAQILGEFLGDVPACIRIGLNLKTVHLTTLGRNQDSTLGTLRAIENDSLCSFEEGNLLYF